MELLTYLMIVIGGLIGAYLLFRIVSMAIFKSWFEIKFQNKERGKENGNGNHENVG